MCEKQKIEAVKRGTKTDGVSFRKIEEKIFFFKETKREETVIDIHMFMSHARKSLSLLVTDQLGNHSLLPGDRLPGQPPR